MGAMRDVGTFVMRHGCQAYTVDRKVKGIRLKANGQRQKIKRMSLTEGTEGTEKYYFST